METNNQTDILLWGGYGYGNTGDELALLRAIETVRRWGEERYAILSPNAELTQWLFPESKVYACPPLFCPSRPSSLKKRMARWWHRRDLHYLWTERLAQWEASPGEPLGGLEALKSAKQLFLVGGGYLSDLFNLTRMMVPIAAAKRLEIRSAPLGLGPFRSPEAARAVASVLRGASLKVRDRHALKFCQANGIEAKLEPDDVTRIAELTRSMWCTRQELGPRKTGEIRIGVNLNRQCGASGGEETEVGGCLKYLASRNDRFRFYGLCFYGQETELETTVRAFRQAGLHMGDVEPASLDFRNNVGRLAEMDAVITSRFHGVVLAQVLGKPYVGLWDGDYYREKMEVAAGYSSVCGMVVHWPQIKNQLEAMTQILKQTNG